MKNEPSAAYRAFPGYDERTDSVNGIPAVRLSAPSESPRVDGQR